MRLQKRIVKEIKFMDILKSSKNKFINDLKELRKLAEHMLNGLMIECIQETSPVDKDLLKKLEKDENVSFNSNYQQWYSETLALIKQVLPERLSEFKELYRFELKRKTIDQFNFAIQDWLHGTRSAIDPLGKKYFNDNSIVLSKYNNQIGILNSAIKKFNSSLFEIKQILQTDLFDSEIQMAEELRRKGFLRAAGVICGVIIEKHLQEVCNNHKIIIKKKNPTIGDFNDKLKESDVIDVPSWRKIQRLGDIRTLCSHKKNREPSQDEIDELLQETDKLIKYLF